MLPVPQGHFGVRRKDVFEERGSAKLPFGFGDYLLRRIMERKRDMRG
jgi:hypothetical protein